MHNYNGSHPIVTNCSFSFNITGGNGGGMYNLLGSSPTVTNCILWINLPTEMSNNGSAPTVSFSDVQHGLPAGTINGGGNKYVDPLFVDADGADNLSGTADDDLRLQTGSPCRDAGNNAAVPAGVTTDLGGNPRFNNTVDMGAYEFGSVHNLTQATWHDSLQSAIDASVNGDQIEANPGTYHEVINFLGKAIILLSASGNPADTIIDGTGFNASVVQCVSGETSATVLSGFTITGGDATGDGGGMYNVSSSPTVTNCSFSSNTTNRNGGGMSNVSSSPTVTNCSFSGNHANNWGSGMSNYSDSSPTVTNCSFSGNTSRCRRRDDQL